jgi:hypothetical protein
MRLIFMALIGKRQKAEPTLLENQGNKQTISSKLQTWSEIPASGEGKLQPRMDTDKHGWESKTEIALLFQRKPKPRSFAMS